MLSDSPSSLSSKLDQTHVEDVKSEKKEVDFVEDASPRNLDTIEETRIGYLAWMVTLAASIGGLLFGYDTGVISGVLVVLGDDLGHALDTNEQELITSITSGGAFIGAVLAGLTADRYGRKAVIAWGCVVFTIGAIVMATSFTLAQMTVGRFIIGFGVGQAAMVVPIYVGELAPAKYRGRMVTIDAMCITGGQVVAYAFGAAFANVAHGWRYMVGLGAVPSLLLLVLLPFCPETPRQLIYHQHNNRAKLVLEKIYPDATPAQVDDKVQLIENGVNEALAVTQGMTWWEKMKLLYTVPANFRALFLACGLMTLQQLSGFNTLMYYSATLFALVGFNNPTVVGLAVSGTNFVFTGISLKYIDRIGRRRILVYTVWGMVVGLVVCAVAFHYIPMNKDLELTTDKSNWAAIVVLVSIIVYVAFYATGLGNVPWQANEFLPMEVRSMGTMQMTMCCWGWNIVVSSTFLSMMKGITPSGTFGFYAALCLIGWIGIICLYPEVAGMSLEEIRAVFEDGFGVRYAEEWRKEHKQALRDKADNTVSP